MIANAPQSYKEKPLEVGYGFARVSAMRSQLLSSSEFHSLLTMELPEIANFLSSKEYKKEILKDALQKQGIALFEAALYSNLKEKVSKLFEIATPLQRKVLLAYLLHFDTENIKALATDILRNKDSTNNAPLLFKSLVLSQGDTTLLLHQRTIADLLHNFSRRCGIKFSQSVITEKDPFVLSSEIDFAYFKNLRDVAALSSLDLLERFIDFKIDSKSLLSAMIMIGEKTQKKINYHNIPRTKKNLSFKLIKKNTTESLVKEVESSYLSQVSHILEYITSQNILTLEQSLDNHTSILSSLLSRQYPLSFYPLFSYLILKEIEITNLMRIVKGKMISLSKEEIKDFLIGQ